MLHNAIERILEAQAGWADPLGKLFVAIFGALYKPVPVIKDLLNGVWLGHPLHPAITDVPIGAYVVALVLDLSGQRTAATAAIGVGIVFMLLAALAGYADYIDLEGKSQRFGTVHSSLMLVALILYVISFLMRLGAVPSPAEVWLSAIGFLIVITAAYVGGELVYNLGTQVDRHAWRGGGTKWTALDVSDVPPDKPTKAKAGAQTLVVVRRGKRLDALHDVCAHQGCSLSEGKIVGETIECNCHGSRYRLRDGLVVHGPAVFDQPHFEVREAEGKLEVRRTDTR
ncbi:MAG TPA: Rieske 2Fe-2S domain-containing protein [Candidatus Limnocylindria bacterium]|nr:Rieske 2Fe-2S domain-containing protein [Candidatus Limnocylindria bacterium]